MTHGTTHSRPPGSFGGAPDGGKGREEERGQTTRQPRNTQQTAGAEDKQREGREEGRTAADREQGESRQKKEYVIYLRERGEKKRRWDSQTHTNK